MSKDHLELTKKTTSIELIIYQIGQLDKTVATLSTQFNTGIKSIDDRVRDIELWQAGIMKSENPKLDVQKIILAAFGLVSTALAIIASSQAGWIK